MACCDTTLLLAPVSIESYVVGDGRGGCVIDMMITVSLLLYGPKPCGFAFGMALVILGTPPGVLLRATRLWIYGVFFNIRFAVGLRDWRMGSAFVIRGMVMIGSLSITLCSSSLLPL